MTGIFSHLKAAALMLAWCAITPQLQAALTFQGLGIGSGDYSAAEAISSDGSVIVGDAGVQFGQRFAFRWTAAGGMENIGTFSATGVSGDGSIVVGTQNVRSGDNFIQTAFRWTQAGGGVSIGAPGSSAYGISSDGSTVVGLQTVSGNYQAFRWTQADGMLGVGEGLLASAVSADGSVIVGYAGSSRAGSTIEPFRWTAETGTVRLGFMQADVVYTESARAVSGDGSVIGGTGEVLAGDEAFVWTQSGGIQGLAASVGIYSYVTGISGDGATIVGSGPHGPFILDSTNGVRLLADMLAAQGVNLSGWSLSDATAISFDGNTIVGTGQHNGNYEAWVVSGLAAAPEPGVCALGALGFLFLLLRNSGRGRHRPHMER